MSICKKYSFFATISISLLILSACSMPLKLPLSSMPELDSGKGRLYVFRESSGSSWADAGAAAIITLNGRKITQKTMYADTFLVADLVPGDYEISAVKESMTSDFIPLPSAISIKAGNTKYVQMKKLNDTDATRTAVYWVELGQRPSLDKIHGFRYVGNAETLDSKVAPEEFNSLSRMRRISSDITGPELASLAKPQRKQRNEEPKQKSGAINEFIDVFTEAASDNQYKQAYRSKLAEEERKKSFNPDSDPILTGGDEVPPNYSLLRSQIATSIVSDLPPTWLPIFFRKNISLEGVQLLRIGRFKNGYWPVEVRIRGAGEFMGAGSLKESDDIKTFDKIAQFQIMQDDFGDWTTKRVAEQR